MCCFACPLTSARALLGAGAALALIAGLGFSLPSAREAAAPLPPPVAPDLHHHHDGKSVPPSYTLGAPPPVIGDDRTVILFSGASWEGWRQRNGQPSRWTLEEDGSVQVRGGDAITARSFRDFHLHLEFRCPIMPDAQGQARGNSGVYLHGRYEVQVLDSYNQPIADNTCGAIYSIAAPMVNATRPAGEWQTYDITFRAPRLNDAGEIVEPARATVLLNGIVIHNNLILPHATPGGLDTTVVAEGPILLQDHGDPVRYRNIWVRDLSN